ncbi:MAG TPA: hypothetical protein V6C69_21870 [Trichormus sp.]
MPRSKQPSDDWQPGESPDDQRYQRNPRQSDQGPRELLRTDIGKVVGGIDAARRFQDLLAKTLRLQQ